MKYITGCLTGVTLALLLIALSPIYAQVSVPFWQWPALWAAAEGMVIKRGMNLDGTPNTDMYIRQGWGACVRVSRREVKDTMIDLDTDSYVSLKDLAVSQLQDGEWTATDRYNCPPQPLQVKPTWRGSRPVYVMEWDTVNRMGTRMEKTRYRAIDGACLRFNAQTGGEPSNYWMLAMDTTVYLDDAPVEVQNIGYYVAAICEPADVAIEDWRP